RDYRNRARRAVSDVRMRRLASSRWVSCALALTLSSPAVLADTHRKHRSIADCTSFGQHEREDDDGVDFTIRNACPAKVSCGIQWKLTCAPNTHRAKTTRGAASFELEPDTSDGTTASTDECGIDGWEISDVSWSCKPAS